MSDFNDPPPAQGRIGGWTRFVTARPTLSLLAALVLTVLAVFAGSGVADRMGSGGWTDPAAESTYATKALEREFPGSQPNLLLLVDSGRADVDSPRVAAEGRRLAERLAAEEGVTGVGSYWGTSSPALRAKDGGQALIAARVLGDEKTKSEVLQRIAPEYRGTHGPVEVSLGGPVAVEHEMTTIIQEDLLLAEAIALPVTLILLIMVFGSAVAAVLPLLIGIVAILGTNAVLRGLTEFTDVSVFAMNLTTALGLGLAIDYALFIVRRFREELAAGAEVRDAVGTTLRTAGRTVLFSALTVAVSLAAMLVFPQYFLRSFAYAGVAVVLLAAAAALVLLPAALMLLGHRINALDLRRAFRRRRGQDGRVPGGRAAATVGRDRTMDGGTDTDQGPASERAPAAEPTHGPGAGLVGALKGAPAQARSGAVAADAERGARSAGSGGSDSGGSGPVPGEEHGGWARLADLVMRRAPLFAFTTIAALLLLGLPFLDVKFGTPDDRQLPASAESHVVQQEIRDGFPGSPDGAIEIFAEETGAGRGDKGASATAPTDYAEYRNRIAALPGVLRVDGPVVSGSAAYFTVQPGGEAVGEGAQRLVHDLREIPAPFETSVTGRAAVLEDSKSAIADKLLLALGIIAVATLLLVFLLTGSLLIPLQAVVLNALSLTAMFGAVVWVFQDGNLSELLGFTPTGDIETNLPVLMFCIAFGLSMDYGVFLLSRIKEEYDRTHDHEHAVRFGLQRTGGLITAAAVILAVVMVAIGTSRVTNTKMLGLGIALAVLMDAMVVRSLLVPSVMKLMGARSWWAPGPLRRFHQRFGLSEGETTSPVSARGGGSGRGDGPNEGSGPGPDRGPGHGPDHGPGSGPDRGSDGGPDGGAGGGSGPGAGRRPGSASWDRAGV
ncbi:MMPL family transporter [Streptomyces albipurpureus]|uniref:MMPL family transporter n=1 Tax=Streptomyces albipurpureus TaxID=2897419 RepID=A0ABT0UUJ1_9ACTN|nr:MMPL family transporter [Streptomyces sp. CWNU-1]MCM2392114.1 MMPL family transporter [Streptomyces sp. CWNU-1]